MRILMLNYEFPPIGGGAGKAHLCLLKEFAGNSELSIGVLTSAPKAGYSVEKFAENITIYKVWIHKKNLHFWRKIEVAQWLFKAWFHYRRLLREKSYDVAHAFFGFPTGWLCLGGAAKLPYIISLRGSDVPGYNVRLGMDYKLLSPVFRRIWKNASVLVANSMGLRKLAAEFMPDLDIGVICNGVYTDRFYPAEEKKPTRRRRRKAANAWLRLLRRLQKSCQTLEKLEDWDKIVAEVQELLDEYGDVVPADNQRQVRKALKLTDATLAGARQACSVLQTEVKLVVSLLGAGGVVATVAVVALLSPPMKPHTLRIPLNPA